MNVRRIPSLYELRKKRVAAYARVSTAKEEQEESLELQQHFYSDFIRKNDQWEFVKVYADEGRSGTSAKKRPGFMEMMEDARAGKLDIIFCKSISRFARNIVDAHSYVHELKAVNVEVRFEKEALSSYDPSSELIFSILAAAAQEESRSISENVKWSYRKHAEKGIRHLGNNRMLGYDEVDGVLTPNKDAWIVELIFREYAAGKSMTSILATLREKGAGRLRSAKPFDNAALLLILKNEVYVGDRKLQKKAPTNYLTKKPDPNVQYQSYYLVDDHKPIIDRRTWKKAQDRLQGEKADRERGVNRRSNCHFLYGLVICAECGQPYIRKSIPTTYDSEGKRVCEKMWVCKGRQQEQHCRNRIVRETEVLKALWSKLGWDMDDFDAVEAANDPVFIGAVKEAVKKVEVTADGIKVMLERAA